MPVCDEMSIAKAYKVLGVSESLTLEEIRSAYRLIMRQHHPDINPDPSSKQIVSDAAMAWEILQLHHIQVVAEEVSATITETEVKIGNFYCKLYTNSLERWWSVLKLPLAYCVQSHANLASLRICLDDGTAVSSHGLTVEVVDGVDIVFSSPIYNLEFEYERFQRRQKCDVLEQQLSGLKDRLFQLPRAQAPLGHSVFDELRKAQQTLSSYQDGWYRRSSYDKVVQAIHQLANRVDELAKTDPLSLAVEMLLSGKSNSHVHRENLQTVAAINMAAARTGGFVEPFTKENMESFYRSRLANFTDPSSHLFDRSLLLDIEDYAPADLLDDADLNAAPTRVPFLGNRGESLYEVSYVYEGDQPVALVRLPLKVYRRHEPAYGRASGFPELPHGIVWACAIEFDGKIVALGRVDLELSKRLDRWEKGRGRAKHAEGILSLGDALYGAETSEVPPWYVGKTRAGRRK